MTQGTLISATSQDSNSWTWSWPADFEAPKGKIFSPSTLIITKSDGDLLFEFTLTKCKNNDHDGTLFFDIVMSFDSALGGGLSIWSDEGVPIQRTRNESGLGQRSGRLPDTFLAALEAGTAKASRTIYI